jgi:hypothetical protein
MLYTPLAKSRIRLVGWTMKHTVKTTQPEHNALSRLSLGFLLTPRYSFFLFST